MPFSPVAKEDASKRKPSQRESQRPGKLSPRNRSEAHPRVRGCRDVRVVPSAAPMCASGFPLPDERHACGYPDSVPPLPTAWWGRE